MRNFISCSLLLLLVFSSCSKNPVKASDNYLDQQVGIAENGKFIPGDIEKIKQRWQERLDAEGLSGQLKNYAIVSGKTDDGSRDYYLLIAKTADGKIKSAALLDLRNGKFFFKKASGPESEISMNILCSGCSEGCDPVVSFQNNEFYLNCSPCTDCVKSEKAMR
ncbi:MAG: hypothetical protein EOO45_19240 [Flavobacterium sp.]|nr:MAG: hypothetical protein EOO45_19240 [Flavobacterium sp.]